MPLTPRDWADPFLEQALADLSIAWTVPSANRGSTFCMVLQMVFEKLGKAAYARSGKVVPKTHKAASQLFEILLRHPSGLRLLRASPNVRQFVAQLEETNPALAKLHPQPFEQLEYPWEDNPANQVRYPEKDRCTTPRR